MARTSPTLQCIFCEQTPCQCGVASRKKAPRPKPVVAKEEVKPRLALTREVQAEEVRRPKLSFDVSDDQLLFDEAIRALAPLLSDYDRDKYKTILNSKLSVTDRARVWRARRNYNGQALGKSN